MGASFLVARGGFGLRSATVGANPRSTGPRAPLDTTPVVSRISKSTLDSKKRSTHSGTSFFSSERGIRTLDTTGMNRML